MKHEIKKQLKDKARRAYGLIDVLKWDVESLREYADDNDIERLTESIYDVEESIQKLTTVIAEIDYIIKTDSV